MGYNRKDLRDWKGIRFFKTVILPIYSFYKLLARRIYGGLMTENTTSAADKCINCESSWTARLEVQQFFLNRPLYDFADMATPIS